MLKTIYSVAKAAREKDIYIYGVNRDAVGAFTNLALWGGDIKGLIDNSRQRHVGKYFMNRPIVSVEQVRTMENVILVIADVIEKKMVEEEIGKEIPIYYCDEIIEPSGELREKDIYIYGIGGYGEKVYKQCCECGIKIKAACVTNRKNITVWNSLPVLEIAEIDLDEDCNFIVATVHVSYQEQMLKLLKKYKGDVYVYNYMLQNHILQGRFFQLIGKAVIENKEIWLYGKNADLKERIKEICLRYSVEIQGEITDLGDLLPQSVSNAIIVIAECDVYEVERISSFLDSLGFALEKWNYTSLACETLRCEEWVKTCPDMLLEWSNMSNSAKYPGFFTYGNGSSNDIRIMILGGSNSIDGIYRTKSWVEFFYEKLIKENYHITIFNGAANGHGSTRELLHLLRDGAYLELDYVISLSGVNNITSHGVKNFFSGDLGRNNTDDVCGIESTESLYEFWHRNIKIMERVTDLYGAKFFPFLQPMIINENMDIFISIMHEWQEAWERSLEFRRLALQDKDGIYTNAIAFFDKNSDMYIDNCHYSNKGNELIANLIYDTLIEKEGVLKKHQGRI